MKNIPENASKSFKCDRCGHMFPVKGQEGDCPVCGNHCTPQACRVVDASDEGY